MANTGSHTAGAPETYTGQSPQAAGIQDVAAAAGVSTATVSRALRGLPRVSHATRERILAAAADLSYVASPAASELARARGLRPVERASSSRGTILILNGPLTGPGNPDEHRGPTPSDIQRLVQSVASEHGFIACVKACDEADMLVTVQASTTSAVGIVINTGSLRPAPRELHDVLASAPIPTVEIRRDHETQSSACNVVISGAGIYGYKLAIEYLGTAV